MRIVWRMIYVFDGKNETFRRYNNEVSNEKLRVQKSIRDFCLPHLFEGHFRYPDFVPPSRILESKSEKSLAFNRFGLARASGSVNEATNWSVIAKIRRQTNKSSQSKSYHRFGIFESKFSLEGFNDSYNQRPLVVAQLSVGAR